MFHSFALIIKSEMISHFMVKAEEGHVTPKQNLPPAFYIGAHQTCMSRHTGLTSRPAADVRAA